MDTKVRLLRYHCLRLVWDDESSPRIYYCTDNIRIYHGEEQQFLEIDAALVPGVEALINSYPNYISVESLPVQSDIHKMQMVADLWERGLLVTEDSLDIIDD